MRPNEVAKLLGCSQETVCTYVRNGLLPGVKIDRATLIPKAAVRRLMDHAMAQWKPRWEREE